MSDWVPEGVEGVEMVAAVAVDILRGGGGSRGGREGAAGCGEEVLDFAATSVDVCFLTKENEINMSNASDSGWVNNCTRWLGLGGRSSGCLGLLSCLDGLFPFLDQLFGKICNLLARVRPQLPYR